MTGLRRSLTLPLLTFYGLGNILGAGIYVLIGKVAGYAGMLTPLSFLLASLVAAFTAISYAELSARFPLSAGEAVYVHRATGFRWLGMGVGLSIALAGVVSAAAIANGFVGYLQVFVAVSDWLAIVLLIIILAGLAAWGITESVAFAGLLTLVELVGLALIITVGGPALVEVPARLPELLPPSDLSLWPGILFGAFLAFYAYLGFEDMVNVAEEVTEPQRNMPRGIFIALVVSTVLYILVALVAVMNVSPGQLQQSSAPLALVYTAATGGGPEIISLISIFAVVNGALIQLIMSTRILYGMSSQGWLPAFLARLHPRTQTPLLSTMLVATMLMILALWLPLEALARITSALLLGVFVLTNLSLCLIKLRDPRPEGVRVWPIWLPATGAVLCLGLASLEIVY